MDTKVLEGLRQKFLLLDPRKHEEETKGVDVQFVEFDTSTMGVEEAVKEMLGVLMDGDDSDETTV
jgi:hypothetical protein